MRESCGDRGFSIGDLIQEGNMSLLLALAEEIPEEGKADWMEERLLAGMESWVKEQTEQKYRDESMVEKVRKLEAAIRELSDDEEQKFSVEELAAYLDMDEEEIRAVLRLTSEGRMKKSKDCLFFSLVRRTRQAPVPWGVDNVGRATLN